MPALAPLERKDLLDLKEEDFDRVTHVNLRGPVFFARKVAREMIWMKRTDKGLQTCNNVCDIIPGLCVFYPQD